MNLDDSGDEDCTALLAMSQGFERILSSSRMQHPLAGMLNFDDDAPPKITKGADRKPVANQGAPLSMRELLAKESEDRLIRIQLENAQRDSVLQSEKIASLESEVKSLRMKCDKDLQEFQRKENALNGNIAQLQEQIARNNSLLAITQRKLLLVTQERDAFQSVIARYKSELDKDIEIVTGERTDHTQCQALLTNVQAELDEANKLLKDALASAKESNLNRSRKISSSTSQENTELKGQIDELKRELEEKSAELECHKERRHLQGHYDPSTTQVLHLLNNPADDSRKKNASLVQDLRAENARLLERLKIMAQEGAAVDDLTLRVNEKMLGGVGSQEVEDLKEQLAKSELKNQRLGEAFKSTTKEFRSIVYKLLGYRVTITGNQRYEFMSMYAETPKDILCFTTASNGDVQILANDYSLSFGENCEHYLQTGNSIPAFLSSITLDLFSKQTILEQ
ncbi:hypothetical protein CAPTEDRAFT_223777 [Capitella teleta]|uniref:Spindle assembly checkpoint component MAD1 n=1 Tax=Capitella teleta TaxID=283909 RepID=R7USR6_CAPTE|nr:hypothetical protein CAPTEDRAFT_223777 [Capitella teleta]|eukprot:ELU09245.1 hypothetical protein CAPTEDRAFT_223777 [Capitella teleta]